MKTIGNIFVVLVAISILGAFFWGLFAVGKYIFSQYQLLNPTLSALVVLIAVVLLTCTYFITNALSARGRNLGNAQVLSAQKAQAYAQFYQDWLYSSLGEETDEEDDYVHPSNWYNSGKVPQGSFQKTKVYYPPPQPDLMLWAAPLVLTSYLILIRKIKEGASAQEIQEQVLLVIHNIRQDIGYKEEPHLHQELAFFFPLNPNLNTSAQAVLNYTH